MRRQLAIFSILWFLVFCAVVGAVSVLRWVFWIRFWDLGGGLPIPTRILVSNTEELGFLSSVVAVVVGACLNGRVLLAAYRHRDQRAARIFHGWALGIQVVVMILFVCFAVIALSLPFLKLTGIR